MSIETRQSRNTATTDTAEFPIDGQPVLLLVRRTSPDGRGGQVASDHVRWAGTDLEIEVSPLESIDDARTRFWSCLARLVAAIDSSRGGQPSPLHTWGAMTATVAAPGQGMGRPVLLLLHRHR
ncbi:hypothetical protein ACFQ36_11145 [Arthrobacter sp. GCM10027362]|uniref:hypothetical protein n=1 Tax=Arthrobacter sp. GCM10027362 TaxID=3273379 RepID=UPI00364135D4